jgi:parallel beta-helix repeat protein
MGNITNGTGALVRTNINNTLMGYDESFYLDLQYYYARNVKQILTFDSVGDMGVTYTGGTYNTTYYKTGDASRGFTNLAGPRTLEASWSSNINLAVFQDRGSSLPEDYISFVVYIGGTLPSSLVIGFSTSQGDYAIKNFEKTITSGFAAGYSFIHVAKTDFTKTGTGFDWDALAYLKLQYTGGDATTDVYFDNMQLIRKDPGSAMPNPFQKKSSTTWTATLAVNSGKWFVGKENGVLICKDINPQDDTKVLLGNTPLNDFQLICELQCLTDSYLFGPSWYVDANNYFKVSIDNNQLTLAYNVNGTPGTVTTTMTVAKNDAVSLKVIKNGSSVFLAATKNTDLNNLYFLKADVNLTEGGYAGLCSKADKYCQLNNYAVTRLEYAACAGDGADDFWKGQLTNKQANVRLFGAKGDGVTDDTVAIQNGINYLSALGGGTLVFPSGRYRVTSQITLYGNIMIDGCNSTIYADPPSYLTRLFYASGGTIVSKSLTADGTIGSFTVSVSDTNSLAAGDYVIIRDTSISGYHVKEFLCIESVTANNVTFTSALTYNYAIASSASIQKITPIKNLVIRNLIIEHSSTADITNTGLFYYLMNAKFENIQVINVRGVTQSSSVTGFSFESGLNIEIKSCYFTKNSSNYAGISASGISNLIVKDNKLAGFKFGLVIVGVSQAIVSGNQVKGCSGNLNGIALAGCMHSIVEGNTVSGGYSEGLRINSGGRTTIKNNSIVGVVDYAIRISNAYVDEAYQCGQIVEGNIIEKGSVGIYISNGTTKSIIKGNHLKDVATQAIYIDIGAVNSAIIGNTIVNPGTDGIYINAPGCMINSNIILNAGVVPINSAVNDVIISNNFIDNWSGTSGGCRYRPGNSVMGNVFINNDTTKYSLYCGADPLPNDGTALIGNISPASSYESGSLSRLDVHSVNLGNVLWNVGQKLLHCNGSPTTGTFGVGDKVFYRIPSANNYIGEVCTVAGTKGTLNGGSTTGSITSGSSTLIVNNATGLVVGCYITIAGVTGKKRVTAISGTTVTVDSNANATVSNAAVAFSAPTMKGFGMIQA